jgi:hypothetical protein
VDPVAARSKAAAALVKQKMSEEERHKKKKQGAGGRNEKVVIDLSEAKSDEEEGGNDNDNSEKTPPKDNGAVGRDNAKKGQTSFQVTEGVELPIFQEFCPRQYLYRYDLKLRIPALEDAAVAMVQVVQGFWFQVKEMDNRAVLVPWAEENIGEHPLVTKMVEFPTSLMNFWKYFP